MIISCPNCFARYTLPDEAMPVDGRKVRCSSCSNIWLATVNDDETPAAVEVVSEETTDKLAAIRAAMEDEASHLDDEGPDEQEKLDIAEDTTDFEADISGDDDEDIAEDIPIQGGVVDPDEIEERFADDPEGDDFDFEENTEVEDFDDSDFDDDLITRRRRHQREEAEYRTSSRRSQMAAVGWVFLILFLGGIVGLFFMVPEKIVNWWPAADKIYNIAGVSSEPEKVHADRRETPKVEIRPYSPSMTIDGDSYKLTLSGKIMNNGLRSVTIPAITFILSDAEDKEILKGSFCMPNRILRKSQSVEFEHIIRPSPIETAKAVFEIKWARDKKGKLIDSCSTTAAS